MVQMVKNLPAMRETWVRSPGGEDPLEEGTATHSSILVWRIPWTEEPGRLWSIEMHTTKDTAHVRAHTHTHARGSCALKMNVYFFF